MPERWLSLVRKHAHWLLLALAMVPAVWHVVDFESDPDGEYPMVERPTFSRYPPAAYRLAEPGDTIDRATLYLASGGLVIAAWGFAAARARGLSAPPWLAALAASAGAFWYAATPGPCPDGWHGLGFRAILDPAAPITLRLTLGVGLAGLAVVVVRGCIGSRPASRQAALLLVGAAVLAVWRLAAWPDPEPTGYWPRWGMLWAVLAFDLALLDGLPRLTLARRPLGLAIAVGATVLMFLVTAGLGVVRHHRPIRRLKEVVPGRIYISAMPDRRGLELAHARHRFRTIINLFPEDTPQRSPLWPQELAFVKDHGVRYLRSPGGGDDDLEFLKATLSAAQDPSNWPLLVHCHGCMDRTPAWLGVYRFVVEGRPLDQIMREIERHRGYRPKASVALMFNRVLPRLVPKSYATDPLTPWLVQAGRDANETQGREPVVRGKSLSGDRLAVGAGGGASPR